MDILEQKKDMLEANVRGLQSYQKELDDSVEILKTKKEAFFSTIADLEERISKLKETVNNTKSAIEEDATAIYEETKNKKFFGGIGIQERQKLVYEEKKALEWAKEKDMFLSLDVKAFEKVASTLEGLDFVTKKTKIKVTFPKEIKTE